MPTAIILAGPNGAGKTSFANAFLRETDETFEFVNADEIGRDLEAIGVSAAERDLRAGRLMLQRLEELASQGRSFVLETTLASRLYARKLLIWRASGYRIGLMYVRLPSIETSLARVAHRVSLGGHDIPEADIRRRFGRSAINLETVYKPLVDEWQVWEGRDGTFTCVERSAP
ncbi:MAG: zeta toxin family protein [Pseudomonadota bacterium]|nr:zeta toxin family protein [Pseudomonadota bacterium]